MRLIEGGAAIGGNHIWSFFASDVAPADRWLVAPLVSHGWDGYDVAFPGASRARLTRGYYSIESRAARRGAARGAARPGADAAAARCSAPARRAVVLADGDRIEAKGVIDARGPGDLGAARSAAGRNSSAASCALDDAARLDAPDDDGRDRRADRRLSLRLSPALRGDAAVRRGHLLQRHARARRRRARARGSTPMPRQRLAGRPASTREEAGVLPVAMGGDFEALLAIGRQPCRQGRGARRAVPPDDRLFAARCGAHRRAGRQRDRSVRRGAARAAARPCARGTWQRRGFYRMLDAMLFRAAEPAERYRVLERFYRLDPRADRALLCRAIDACRQAAHPGGQAAGADRPRDSRRSRERSRR